MAYTQQGLHPEMLKIFETVPSMYLILSVDLMILTASDLYLQTTGRNREDIQGKYIFDVFPIDEQIEGSVAIRTSLMETIRSKSPNQLPVTRSDPPNNNNNGPERYWHTLHTPVFNQKGEILYIIHSTRDVSAQIIAEKELKISLEKQTLEIAKSTQLSRRLEKLFADLPARIAILSGPDFIYEFINPIYHQYFGFRDLIGKPILKALPELEGHPLMEELQRVFKTGVSYEGNEICIPLKNTGNRPLKEHYFNIMYQARLDEEGNVNGILSFAYDITELVHARKKVEDHEKQLLERVDIRTLELQLAQKEAMAQSDRLRRFFMQSPAGICILDGPELVFEMVNPTYQQLFPGRVLTGKTLLDALPELRGLAIPHILKKVYQTGKTFEGTGLHVPLSRTPQGPIEDRYFNFIYQARLDGEDNIDGILVFVFEVTEMMLAEQQLEENQQRLNFLLNAMPQQVWTAKPDGSLDYVNQVVCDDFGKDPSHLIGNGWQDFIHPDDLKSCLSEWKKSLETDTEYNVEFRLRMRSGLYKWHLGRAVPLIENGKVKLWMGTNTNIDLQKINEYKKDEFLSIASHELKTPLTSIKAFNQLMLRTTDIEKLQKFTLKSAESIFRLDKLISDLLDVNKINAGKMQYNMEVFSFNEMLHQTAENVQHTTTSLHNILLEQNETIVYTGDRIRIEQVVTNFLTNAIKYSPSANRVIIKSSIKDGNIIVSIEDFGIGIAKRDINHLFERYYRAENTALRFEGLGLGLFISSEILKRHRGSFWVESEPGSGSTFYFKLPLAAL